MVGLPRVGLPDMYSGQPTDIAGFIVCTTYILCTYVVHTKRLLISLLLEVTKEQDVHDDTTYPYDEVDDHYPYLDETKGVACEEYQYAKGTAYPEDLVALTGGIVCGTDTVELKSVDFHFLLGGEHQDSLDTQGEDGADAPEDGEDE
jgi:hypothetical protein